MVIVDDSVPVVYFKHLETVMTSVLNTLADVKIPVTWLNSDQNTNTK